MPEQETAQTELQNLSPSALWGEYCRLVLKVQQMDSDADHGATLARFHQAQTLLGGPEAVQAKLTQLKTAIENLQPE